MLTKAEALALIHKHLGHTPRAAHSRFVAYVIRELAGIFAANADLWEITGLCHDLDFFVTCGDWSQHGLLTIRWLAGQLPDDALDAIAAHDYRTGIRSDTLIADMLNLAERWPLSTSDLVAIYSCKPTMAIRTPHCATILAIRHI
jgi:predicted hydrolase (HD superfamily)